MEEKYTTELLSRMAVLISNSRCSKYKIMGYKYVESRLILYFKDCAQVYDFDIHTDFDTKTYEITVKKFYTADYEYIECVKRFEAEANYEKPE